MSATAQQLHVLKQIGVSDPPTDQTEAQALIQSHFRPKSKQGHMGRVAQKKRKHS